MGKLGTFVALGVRGRGMIENCSFNLGEFYVKKNVFCKSELCAQTRASSLAGGMPVW